MFSQRAANLVFLVIVICACAYFAWAAESFTTSGLLAGAGLPSKFFPQLMLGITALCALAAGYGCLARGGSGGDDGETVFAGANEARQGLLMLLVAVSCYAIWRNFGFLPMALLLGPLSLLAMGVFKPLLCGIVLALTAAVTLIFTYGLGVGLI